MNHFIRIILLSLLVIPMPELVQASKCPSTYTVHQQQGPVCPYMQWTNLNKIQDIRNRGNGKIIFQDSDFSTKINSYAYYLPRMHSLDQIFNNLREGDGPYAQYERALRADGIKSNQIYDAKGQDLFHMDEDWVGQGLRASFTPYNILVIPEQPLKRWLPILQKAGTQDLYFYDHLQRRVTILKHYNSQELGHKPSISVEIYEDDNQMLSTETICLEEWMLDIMGVTKDELKYVISQPDFIGFKTAYFLPSTPDKRLNQEYYFDMGSYQNMLFACGVNSENNSFENDDTCLEARAYRELHEALEADPLNPWSKLDKKDLFQFHLTDIFKTNPELKLKAIATTDYFNPVWRIYKESLELYDNHQEPRTKLIKKQRFMPGEDQVLAFMFTNQLRFLWAATINGDAVQSVEGAEEMLPDDIQAQLKAEGRPLRTFNSKEIIDSAYKLMPVDEQISTSFMSTWQEIYQIFMKTVVQATGKKDFVSFSNHGYVISFDEDLIKQQTHEFPEVAAALGFEFWDSLYEKELLPFYVRPGTKDDIIKFE